MMQQFKKLPTLGLVALLSVAAATTANAAPQRKKKRANTPPAAAAKKQLEVPAPLDTVPPTAVGETAKPAGETAVKTPEPEEITNARMKTMEGSRSRWSGQVSLGYSGPSITKPLSGEAPNPTNVQPVPLVTMTGSVSGRYRIDRSTTVGLGTGITTQTPFQGPKNTTIADPYVDFTHSYKLGKIQNRTTFGITLPTNQQDREQLGARLSFSVGNESFYEFPFGLLTGLAVSAGYTTFASGDYSPGVLRQQIPFGFAINPYVEYRINNTLNLRSVFNVSFLNQNSVPGFSFYIPRTSQTLGLGVAAADWLFVYPYVRFTHARMTLRDTTVGFSLTANLF